MGFAKKVDANQKELCDYIRELGGSVLYLHSVGGGVPDICVGYKGKNYLCEIKTLKGSLNELQVKWHNNYKGQCCVIRTKEDINELLGVLK